MASPCARPSAAVLGTFLPAVFASLLVGCAADPSAATAAEPATTEDDLTRAECRGPRGETEPACRVEGVVERQVTAEFDPFVVGDACVTFVKVGARRYGLVRDVEACPDESRFENGNVKVSFSKGALTLVARERSRVLKGFDGGVTYYDFTGELRIQAPPPPTTPAEFDALSGDEKYELLYDGNDTWANLREGFSEKAIRIVDELDGATEQKALSAYYAMRSEAFQNGGDKPEVVAIQKGGVTWAYAIHISGRSFGNWWSTSVYDRSFESIGGFGGSD